MKKKGTGEKEEKYWKNEDQILKSLFPYRISANKPPYILIYLWFHCMEHNTIIGNIPKKLEIEIQGKYSTRSRQSVKTFDTI